MFDDPELGSIATTSDAQWKKDWKPFIEPFNLSEVKEPIVDFETASKSNAHQAAIKWWRDARPIGMSVTLPDGRSQYWAWGHCEGNNCTEEQAVAYLTDMRGKRILNQSTKFEVHMAKALGVDLEELGCTVGDVSHYAALLDDHRKRFNLDELGKAYAPGFAKLTEVHGVRLDKSRMASYHAGIVGPYACQDGVVVRHVANRQYELMREQGLERVAAVEDECTFATCEMERNGAIIDTEKLDLWVRESERELHRCLMEIYRLVGVKLEPNKDKTWETLFSRLKIPVTDYTDSGKSSFTDDVLVAKIEQTPHEALILAYKASKIEDLRSKALVKFHKTIGSDRILRYALHQLRSDEGGTVQGRFSSSGIADDEGANIQQVSAVGKQIEKYGSVAGHPLIPGWLIRELFVAPQGFDFFASDAEQIEYRIFADHAQSPQVIAAYQTDWNRLCGLPHALKNNERVSFHKLIWNLLRPFKEDLGYKSLKNLNFAKIYGAGLAKLAFMMGFITKYQLLELQRRYAPKGVSRTDPLLRSCGILDVDEIYARELPEAPKLIKKASDIAKERGYVKTALGRRIRFPAYRETAEGRVPIPEKLRRLHKALNGVIQGSAADIMKLKLIELRRRRKELDGFKLRMSVHDEIAGDSANAEVTAKVDAVLNQQSFKMDVPILWKTDTGHNWAECK